MYRKAKTTILIIMIIFHALFIPMSIKRESLIPDEIIMPISLDTALDMSLAYGDGRLVDWRAVEV